MPLSDMAFRPTLRATIVVVPALIFLLGLGTWQVQRLAWKNDLIQTRTDRIAAVPMSMADAMSTVSPEAIEYRPVRVSGDLRTGNVFRLLNRVHAGKQGFHVVAPMMLDEGRGNVLIDLGWAPRDMLDVTPVPQAGKVSLVGYVRAFTAPGAFLPDNEPANNNWFYMDEAQMLAAAGLPAGPGFYLEAGPDTGTERAYPLGAAPALDLRNSHLEYAVTWYGLAAVLAVIFVVFHWRREGA